VLCVILLFFRWRDVPAVVRDAIAVAKGELTEPALPPGAPEHIRRADSGAD
jgi:hypothetical protein